MNRILYLHLKHNVKLITIEAIDLSKAVSQVNANAICKHDDKGNTNIEDLVYVIIFLLSFLIILILIVISLVIIKKVRAIEMIKTTQRLKDKNEIIFDN